ncbi:M15 family metallopeptidase [Actinokineospora sp. UTMC 2448]|uniref:M15 family metallopeptidase n=1 Tax=Actinokineospora sp. UTMC 2448 TaxID=2268449 RepID=UPI0021645F52|nr:M15 family metallopeptidase [Actinokineospora sp. UTMC 2448]
MRSHRLAALAVALIALAGCTTPAEQRAQRSSASPTSPSAASTSRPAPVSTSSSAASTSSPVPTTTRPVWVVGAKPLPLRPDGFGQILPTPPVLANRALPTTDILPPPRDDRYASTIAAVPPDVLARSTWQPECPVAAADLRYLTMTFWGFDGRHHTGEMIVHKRVAEGVTQAFASLHAVRFPLEEMRVTTRPELDLHPTGDGNNTTAFVCRPAVNLKTWSAHASGLAIDVNPFCNPYIRGDLVLPELASSYVDRGWRRPGMLYAGDEAVRAFTAIGWSWGGNWTSPVDIQHFTATGR